MAFPPEPAQPHRWHPAIVHFPIACWSLCTAIDLLIAAKASLRFPGVDATPLSYFLLWTGIVSALPAAIAGLVDYVRLPEAVQDGSVIDRHMLWMGSAWALFLGAGVARVQTSPLGSVPPRWIAAIELAGFFCLFFGGRAAATVVFEQVAKSPRAGG